MSSSPIADLTYRNYDGPLEPPIHRWWAIARLSMRLSLKKKGFWVWSSFSSFFYVILLIVFYVQETAASQLALANNISIFKTIRWSDQFLNCFGESQLFLFILALLMGAGAIANDNRAKALLVYLSKPCSRMDYIIGKWVGIFIPITLVSAIPMLLFYGYCLMSYRSYGFWSQDPWLIVRLCALSTIPGICYASLSLGISSLFQQGRLAGAVFAGLYFISSFFTLLVAGANVSEVHNEGHSSAIITNLFYCSVDGIQYAMAKIILHTRGGPLIPIGGSRGGGGFIVDRPSFLVFGPLFFIVCGAAVALAWSRVKAVEVVG